MECRDWRERISASVDGEVSPEEARRIEGHIEECAECRALERKMRAVGIGVARAEGVVPPDFREKLFSRMEEEDLLPRRRSLFVFSLRWAAVPVAAAAALALFMLTSADKGRDAVSPRQTAPAVAQTAVEQLTPEDREIIANLDILEDPSDLDPPGDVDEMEIFAPPARSRG
jgi:predicted anti-sigma-YlaC factor YlaD